MDNGNNPDRPGLSELGTDGQKHEISAEEKRAELGVDGQKHELPANLGRGKSHVYELA